MDAHNRGYNAGLNVTGNQIGNATLLRDADDAEGIARAASFFAQAYTLANGQTVISYRGADVVPFVTDPFYSPSSWADVAAWSIWAAGNYQTAQVKRVRWVERSETHHLSMNPDTTSVSRLPELGIARA
jgi:hypothetical protein